MQLRDIMTKGGQVIDSGDSIRHAAEMMRDLDLGVLPVSRADSLVGILTDRDITVRAIAAGASPDRTRVEEVMSPGVEYAYEDEEAELAAQTMKDKQVRRLLVMNRNNRFVGIVSLGDLSVRTGDESLSGDVLSEVSKPVH